MATTWTPSQVHHAETYLEGIGKKYGQDWVKDKSAASRISSAPLAVSDSLGMAMSGGPATPGTPRPAKTFTVDAPLFGKLNFEISKGPKMQPVQPQSGIVDLHQASKAHYPHVPGGADVQDPYQRDAARQAGIKAVKAIDQYVIGNIPIVASFFGSMLTTIMDQKRREVAQEKLQEMQTSGQIDPLREAKYRSKLFSETAKSLEEALREVRLALEYFERTARVNRQNPTCDYMAHLYGFLSFSELRIEELDTYVDEITAYTKALHEAIKQGKSKLHSLKTNELAKVLTDVVAAHPSGNSCGKNCCYDDPARPKTPPKPTHPPSPQTAPPAVGQTVRKPLPTPPIKH